MVRRLTLVLMLSALLIPGGAFALGLGDIHLKSALNQAFDAHIDLLSVKADELDGVKISLASSQAFERAGIDRLFILTKLRYEANLNKEGQPVIHVTSRQAIREPFLNFLIEVNWAKGRLVREYTVLLDPPVTLDRKPAPVSVPVTASPAPKTVQPSLPASTETQQRQSQVSVTEQSKPAEAVVSQAGANEYGPVMANESLWPIAMKTKPQGVTVEQMMIALQRKNPHAFIRQNVNNLKRGSILRMPTQAEIDLLSVREARAEFSNQVAEWKAYRTAATSSKVASAPEATASKKQPEPDSELKLASVRPEGEGKGGASEGDGSEEITSKLENELILAREQFESAKQERTNLSSQVSQLEGQLTDLENLLAVRNEQLARLQNELKQSEADAAQKSAEAPMAEVAPDVDPAGMAEAEIETTKETEELEVADTEEKVGEPEADEKEEMSEVAPKPQAIVQPEVPEAASTESILDILKDQLENNMIAVAGGGLAILLLLLLLARRKKAEGEEFEESILVGTQGEDTESLGSAGSDTEGVMSEAAETSFLSEFSHSDMDVLQDDTGEVDPVAEADVYIAYGRYQQAEELLQQAIARDPDHIKSYFKLLEILFVTKDAQAFTETAETLATKNPEQADADGWQQVLAMGHQLNPEHELFVGAEGEPVAVDYEQPAAAPTEAGLEATADEQSEDLDLMGLSDLTADFDSGDGESDEPSGTISTLLEDDSLDFDLDLGLDVEEDGAISDESLDVDDALLSADIGEISSDDESNDALMDLSDELPDSSIPALDVETETNKLEESLNLDEMDLGDSFEADALEEEESEQSDDQNDILGESEDLAAALSSFTDEPVQKEAANQSSEGDGLSLDDGVLEADDLGDLGEELEGLSADLSIEENSAALGDELEGLGGLDDSLSLDDLTDEGSDSPGDTLESDELMLGDLEQEVSKLEDIGDQDDLLTDVSLDDLELGELSTPEGDSIALLDTEEDLPDLSDEDLMIGDDFGADLAMDEPMSELIEEPDKIDEINTKLDLARAYVEMGDEEGARNILDEVLNEGDDVQKQDAQELLGRLS